MKATGRSSDSRALINDLQLARIQLDQAESKWKFADEQARLARRRRKEAKAAARRAKKQARQAREEFAEAKEALLSAEQKFTEAVERTAHSRKLALTRREAKAVTGSRKTASGAFRTPRTSGAAHRKPDHAASTSGRRHQPRPPGLRTACASLNSL